MAVPIGSLFVSLQANVSPFAQGMARAETITATTSARIRRNTGIAERSVHGLFNSTARQNFRPYSLIAVSRAFDNAADRAGLLRGSLLATTAVFGGFAAALSSNVILRYADSFTSLTNLIRVVSTDTADLTARTAALAAVSARSRSSLEATAVLYARIQKAVPQRSADEVLRFTETIQKALVLGGATAQEVRSAAIQFSQGIASNRLGGEELRAILETPLGLELSRGLDVTIGKFREMGHAGELTADVILGALEKIAGRIDDQFSEAVRTLDQALVHVDNRLTDYIGTINKAYGGTNLISRAIVAFGDNLETIVPTLANILGLLAAVTVARNKALVAGLVGGAGGAFVGNELGGLSGAIVGGLAGGILGFRGPAAFQGLREAARATKDEVRDLTGRVADLRKEFLLTADARRQALIAQRGDPIAAARPAEIAALSRRSLNPNASTSDIQAAAAVARASGQRRLATEVERTTAAYKAAGKAYQGATTQLASVARAATVAGQAKVFLGRQVTSLVGLFGGPWGVAITAAIGLLAFLGIQSQKTSQQIAQARSLISKELESLAEAGDKAAAESVLQLRLNELEDSQKIIDDYIRNIRRAIEAPSIFSSGPDLFFERRRQVEEFGQKVLEAADQLKRGEITLEQFNGRLSVIDQQAPKIQNITDAARENAEEIARAGQALSSLSKKIDDLRAEVNEDMVIRFRIAFTGRAGDEQRFAPAGAFAAFEKEMREATDEILRDLDDQIRVAELAAKGLEAEAKAQKIINKAREEGKFVDEAAILAKVELLDSLQKEAAALKKAGTAADTLTAKLARLRAESGGAFLSDLDRQVVEQARSLKVAASIIDDYIAAVQSSNLSSAPPMLRELRDFELLDRAASSAQGIIEQYGTWSQIAPLVAEKQQELNIAVEKGAITADQAKVAMADYLGQFNQFQLIEGFASAFGDLVKSGVDGWDSLKEGAEAFLKRIRDLIVELLIIQPLINSLKGAFGGIVGGGSSTADIIASAVGPGVVTDSTLFHGGGIVGAGGVKRSVPASAFVGAPRFHGGLQSGERAGIFKVGEEVLTRAASRREMGIVAGLSKAAGMSSVVQPVVNVFAPAGHTAEVQTNEQGELDIMVRQVEGIVARSIFDNGPVSQAINRVFSAKRTTR